jgi:hypothetical protein
MLQAIAIMELESQLLFNGKIFLAYSFIQKKAKQAD